MKICPITTATPHAMLILALTLALLQFWSPAPALAAGATTDVGDEVILKSDVTWTNEESRPVTLSQFKDSMVVLTMMYSQCTKICPGLTVGKLKEIQTELDHQNKKVEFIIATFDPENDTPEVLASFKKRMHVERDNWHFIRGTQMQTRHLARQLRLGNYWQMDEHIIHDFRIVLLEPQTHVRRELDRDHPEVGAFLKSL